MNISIASANHHHCIRPCQVPLSPDAMTQLYARYVELINSGRLPKDMGFEQYYAVWRSGRRGGDLQGLDDGANPIGIENPHSQYKITRPTDQLRGVVQTLVLLVDFPNRPNDGTRTAAFYEQMLFSESAVFPSGSMRQYFQKVSNFSAVNQTGVDVQGQVHGWLRLPQDLDYYSAGNSGLGAFPRNAQGMISDAVTAAMTAGVDFRPYDMFGRQRVTALFVVHAGSGAEQTLSRDDIWSHKWVVPSPITVAPGIQVETYLTVPENCNMGVCAHEWGHLAAGWADYYDTGTVRQMVSNGLGNYCLMAAGSWGQNGLTPVFPNAMLRMFHGWIEPYLVEHDVVNFELTPAAEGGTMLYVRNPKYMAEHKYIVIEYRRRRGQDAYLPDEGIAVYVVDEYVEDNNQENFLAIELIQADGLRDLSKIFGTGNRGDSGDLYGDGGFLGQNSTPPLNFTDGSVEGVWAGVSILISGTPGAASMRVSVTMAP